MTASDARALATRLATLDPDALAAVFDARRIAPNTSWTDFFDAADALLDPAQLSRALADVYDLEAAALRDAVDACCEDPDFDVLVAPPDGDR